MVVIKIDKIVKFFVIAITFLVTASVFGQIIKYSTGHDFVFGFVPKFNLDEEMCIPAFFSAIMLFVSGVLLAFIAKIKKNECEQDIHFWRLLSCIFLFLSFDEACGLHELFIEPLRELTGASGFLYFAWIIPYSLFLFAFLVYFFKFFLRLDNRTKIFFLIAGTLYITGALGIEMLGGWYCERLIQDNFIYIMITTVEETLEMIGIAVFIFALLDYLNRFSQEIVIKITSE